MFTPPNEDPPGGNPRGDNNSDGDHPVAELQNIGEELFESDDLGYLFESRFLAVLSVIEESARTHFTAQKFIRYLAKREMEPFQLVSLYLGGACSREITYSLHEMTDAGLLSTQSHERDEVNADVYRLTPKAKQIVEEIDVPPELEERYRTFRARFGRTGSWNEHDEVVYRWLTREENYIAVDKKLYEALKRKVAHSQDFDSLFEKICGADDSVVSHLAPDIQRIAKLALYLAKDTKEIPPKEDREIRDEDYLRNRRRFSIRHIKNDFSECDIGNELVLLRGYVEECKGSHEFYFSENRLSTAEDIRFTFYGDWLGHPDELLEQVIGVIGYLTESDTEPVVRALGLIKWNELPSGLKNRFKTDEDAIAKQRESTEALIEGQQEFFESHKEHDGEVKSQVEDAERLREEIQELIESLPETEDLRKSAEWLQETTVEMFNKYSDAAMRVYVWYEILKEVTPVIANLFK